MKVLVNCKKWKHWEVKWLVQGLTACEEGYNSKLEFELRQFDSKTHTPNLSLLLKTSVS